MANLHTSCTATFRERYDGQRNQRADPKKELRILLGGNTTFGRDRGVGSIKL